MANDGVTSGVAAQAAPALSERQRQWIFGALLMGTFLSSLEVTVVGTVMPTIVSKLGGMALYAWVATAYILTSTVTVPLCGRLSDIYGRKPVILGGMAVFMVGSLMCGLAWDIYSLIGFRALQGLGAGALIPTSLTMVGDLYPAERRAWALSLFSLTWAVSAALGPALGAGLVEVWSWRAAFMVSIPFGLVAMTVLGKLFHDPPRQADDASRRALDVIGTLQLLVGASLLLLGLSEVAGEGEPSAQGGGWGASGAVAVMVVGAALLAWFMRRQRRTPKPLMHPQVLAEPAVQLGVTESAIAGTVLLVLVVFLPMAVQGIQQVSPLKAGMMLVFNTFGWTGSSLIGGRVLPRVGPRRWLLTAGVVMVGGAALLQGLSPTTPFWRLCLGMTFVGAGMGMGSLATMVGVQNNLPWALRGAGTSLLPFFRSMGGAVGVALCGGLINRYLLATQHDPVALATLQRAGFQEIMPAVRAALDPATRGALDPALKDLISATLQDAIGVVFTLMLIITLGRLLLLWLWKRPMTPSTPQTTPTPTPTTPPTAHPPALAE
jgi:EmrB/QacA subfamily drug resistance transporter